MRITTSMIQRNVLSDLNTLSEKMARTQSKASSGKEITRPSDDPFNTARAMGLRQTMDANNQYSRNIDDAMGWQARDGIGERRDRAIQLGLRRLGVRRGMLALHSRDERFEVGAPVCYARGRHRLGRVFPRWPLRRVGAVLRRRGWCAEEDNRSQEDSRAPAGAR